MKKGILKAVVLIAVFCSGILGFGQLTNHTNQDLTAEMADATLPVVSFSVKNADSKEMTALNELRGYTSQMNGIYMRDTITPIHEDRVLPVQVDLYETKVDGISYEIRSLDMERLIVDTEVEKYEQKDGRITANLQIQNLLEPNEEYLFILKLRSKKDTIYYYTRIIEEQSCYSGECAAFTLDFHKKTFDKEGSKSLAVYLEPNASGDNSTLHKVDIHSSLKQVAWAQLDAKPLTSPIPSIKETNSSYTVVMLNFLVAAEGIKGEMEYYNVEEYYRVRYTKERMYLLNYERTMEQMFRAENVETYENYLQLGIRSEDVEFASNEKGTVVSFVQGGELWSYNETSSQLARVFSFIGNEGVDARENYGEHDIRIISVDETGSVDFVVYGYMNCGRHEGKVGISVYHYDSVANTVEEELFIPSEESYQVMKADLGQLMYENSQGIFFIMLEGTVYRIDLSNMKVKEYITGLKEGLYAISDSHKYFAWTDGQEKNKSEKIHFVNLDTEEQKEISAKGDEYLKPLGFIEEDFVYGAADASDLFLDLAGNQIVPMRKIRIVEADSLDVLKSYEKEGYFVEDIVIEDYIMYLNRIQFNGVAYVEAPQDTIMDREGDKAAVVGTHTTVTEVKETQVQLFLAEGITQTEPKILTPKEVVLDKNREVALNRSGKESNYYAYARGDVLRVTDDLKEAISVANEQMGVVIGKKQQYIWKRARKFNAPAIEVAVGEQDANASSLARCISAMLEQASININVTALIEQGKTPKEILETTMEDVTALDLTGCSIEEVLYYINLGAPVLAIKSGTQAVLLTGYDSSGVILFDPLANSSSKMSLSDAEELFLEAGNVFFGYTVEK